MKHVQTVSYAKTRKGIKTALKFVILVLVFILFVLLFQIYQNIEIATPNSQGTLTGKSGSSTRERFPSRFN